MVTITPATYRQALHGYVYGFLLSIAFTLGAYWLVRSQLTAGTSVIDTPWLVILLLAFALSQLIVQLWFFLHLGEEKKPRWRLLTMFMAVVVALIVIIGSMWIMSNLDYNMSQSQIDKYLNSQSDL